MPRLAILLLALPLALVALMPRPTRTIGATSEPHALVRLKGTSLHTWANAEGHFSLPARPGRLTAWKPGFFIAGSRTGSILRLRPLPRQDNEDYQWIDPTPEPRDTDRCGNCHRDIYREWKSSGHSRSATGKKFRDLYADPVGKTWSLLHEHPDGSGVCASCHAPTLDDGDAILDLRKVAGTAAQGVHCDYCHKVSGLGKGDIGLTHGRYLLTLLRPKEGQLFFGPLDDVDRDEDTYSPFQRDSRLCAACHEGVVFGVKVYGTYSEWLQSPARRQGKHCQDCHMKPTGKMTNIAPGHGGIERDPATLGNHRFFDGSQRSMLRRSVAMSITSRRVEKTIEVTVRLTARHVGHRIPTGFIDRHLLLVVEGKTARGTASKQIAGDRLGREAGKTLAGRSGRIFGRLLADEQGTRPVPFWRSAREVSDTRLLPGRSVVLRWRFSSALARVRIRLIHRRFWAETRRIKGWPSDDQVIHDRTQAVSFRDDTP